MIIGEPILLGGGESASIFCTGDVLQTDTVTASKGSKTKNGKWVQRENPEWVVPSGYTQLTYLESTSAGTAIDTGLKYLADYKTETKAEYRNNYNSRGYLFGDRNTSSLYSYVVYHPTSTTIQYQHSATAITYSTAITVSVNTPYIVYTNNGSMTINSTTVSCDSGTYETADTIILFGLNDPTKTSWGSNDITYPGRIYYHIVKTSADVLIGNFVPCKRNSDNALGYINTVDNSFHGNLGTGTFTAGDEVPQYIYGFEISNINEYGTWTVTATRGSKTTSYDVAVDMAEEYEVDIELLGYTIYDYIVGDGASYINTNINPTNAITGELKMNATSVPTSGNSVVILAGGTSGFTTQTIQIGFGNSSSSIIGVYWLNGSSAVSVTTGTFSTGQLVIQFDASISGKSITINGTKSTISSTVTAINASYPFYLCCGNRAGTASYFAPSGYKYYYLKLYSSGTLVGDFIPAMRNSDNEVGMYDKVTETFFTNQGTGSFVGGDD